MSTVGQIEKKTQRRIVKLFRETLRYDYLGDWTEREDNRNIEESYLRSWLEGRGYSDVLIKRALHKLNQAAGDTSKTLYDRNRAVYDLLRYAVKVSPDVGEKTVDVKLIDWEHPEKNHFAIVEEVTVAGNDAKAYGKRPDIVLYVNGIALGVLELKRSTVSVAEGIRQNLDNQKTIFIERFFSTTQLLMAGNDSEGLRYGSIETQEKYYLTWKEEGAVADVAPGFSPASDANDQAGLRLKGAGLKPGAMSASATKDGAGFGLLNAGLKPGASAPESAHDQRGESPLRVDVTRNQPATASW